MSNSNIDYWRNGGLSNAEMKQKMVKAHEKRERNNESRREKSASTKHASPSHSLIKKQSTKKKETGYSLASVLTMAIQRKKRK